MTSKVAVNQSELIDGVVAMQKSKLGAKQAAVVMDFTRLFFTSVAADDIATRTVGDLYASTFSLWHFLQVFDGKAAKVQVFNPDFDSHGWHSRHTVILITQSDMPFLVDSVRMELNRQNLTTHLHIHMPMRVQRGADGKIAAVERITEANTPSCETPMYIEVDRINNAADMNKLAARLQSILTDVRLAVSDFRAMRDKLDHLIGDVEKNPPTIAKEKSSESVAFLRWLLDDHFIFMGYRAYDVEALKNDHRLNPVRGSSLGLMSKDDKAAPSVLLSTLSAKAKNVALNNQEMLVLTKTRALSTIHRPAQLDYIGVKRYDNNGNVVGEHRFFGLYTSAAYNRSPRNIPVVRQKISEVTERSGLVPNSHDAKALRDILETFPRDELFQISTDELLAIGMGVLYIKERAIIRVFVRRDPYGRFFSCFVYTPRDIYTTKLRLKFQSILAEHLCGKADEIRFSTWFSDSVSARTHFIVPTENAEEVEFDIKAMEADMREAARSWDDHLSDALAAEFGDDEGKRLAAKYGNAFPSGYRDETNAPVAVNDIRHIESLNENNHLSMLLYRPQEDAETTLRFKLYRLNQPMSLSDVLPALENMGLTVIGETPHHIERADGSVCWIMDFSLQFQGSATLQPDTVRDVFQEAFAAVWRNHAENDGFNRLVLGAGLTWREVSVLRAYAKYFWQIGFTFSQSSIEQTLAAYPAIARQLVQWFNARYEPGKADAKRADELLQSIRHERAKVATLDQDRIIGRYLDVIRATVRTNYFQADNNGTIKSYVSFKLRPQQIPDIPKPTPMFEIWVYSPRVEGLHLRFGKVARGGLRWSDRREDFRTEILGLVKAQQVKNTVIVPNGAKGGFVCKQMPKNPDRQTFMAEGIACYQTFIRALLDITDNIVGGKLIAPKNVVRHDEDDPYLVVAADKGTATFSDIANAISIEYNHWLGDAFASGGSNGYDHKKMGITARGAWECVKRHFREMGKDIQSQDFSVIGVGDMSGDVFGNGMLLSKHIRLLAAFDHRHIFLDPEPDAAKSFVERQRLFNLPSSSWDDYDKKLISKGGGVFARSAKTIALSVEVRRMLGTDKAEMSPNELMNTILKMDIELLWNGGIGTYVKAASQRHNEVGDRANDGLRVDGRELRAKVIGEGGNLGMTQLGRIEYMLNGGRGNTDFIDNAAGVNTSDNEVNIKIVLNALVASGDLTDKQRIKVLADMTNDVGDGVLQDNYRQSQSISITESRANAMVKEHIRFIHQLEREGRLDRGIEFLPSDEELQDRMIKGKGLTRAELSVLNAYGKMSLKEELCVAAVVNNAFYHDSLRAYFPKAMRDKFADGIDSHRLRGEIIAMQLANEIVNFGGANFAHRMVDETGADFAEVSTCFTLAKEVFGIDKLFEAIEALDNKVSANVQIDMMFEAQRMLRRSARWFLRQRRKDAELHDEIARFKPSIDALFANLTQFLEPSEASELQIEADKLIARSVPKKLAQQMAFLSTVFAGLDIAEVAQETAKPIELVAETYFRLGVRSDLHWFLSQIVKQPVDNHWQAFARAAFREELDWHQRQLTLAVLKLTDGHGDASARIDAWFAANNDSIKRWLQLLTDFRTSQVHEFAKFSVALRELGILVQTCMRQKSLPKVKAADKAKLPAAKTAKVKKVTKVAKSVSKTTSTKAKPASVKAKPTAKASTKKK